MSVWLMSVVPVASVRLLAACLLLVGTIVGCGDNDLELGTGKEGSTLQFGRGGSNLSGLNPGSGGGQSGSREIEDSVLQGNVFNLQPASLRPIVVFAFVDLQDTDGFQTFQTFKDAEVSPLEEDRTFHLTNLAAGSLTVVFLLDGAGVNQDGTIDPGDPIAVFQDTSGLLRNLSANTEVTLQDVDLLFRLNAPNTGTATVKTEANIIVTQGVSPPSSEPP